MRGFTAIGMSVSTPTMVTSRTIDAPVGRGPYSRDNPSPRYRALVSLYRQMHAEGVGDLPADLTFAGQSLAPHLEKIRDLIRGCNAHDLLDYGSGKGLQYRWTDLRLPDGTAVPNVAEYWGVEVTCYDPAYPPHSALPAGKFDGVICTDVLEHCPEDDIPWIVEEIFSFSRCFVYANVACYPAKKSLPTGENAHCTIRPPRWWRKLLNQVSSRHPAIRYRFALDVRGNTWLRKKFQKEVVLSG